MVQKTANEGSVAILSKVSDKREHVWEVISTRVGKIIQVTFRTVEGRKMVPITF